MRQTPFQNVGQQSFTLNQMTQPQSQMNQFLQDYDMYTRQNENTNRRPKSRELDMMNLLLIGSMTKGNKKSGLEGLDQFLGPQNNFEQQQSYIPQQNSLANFGQQIMGTQNKLDQLDPLQMQYQQALSQPYLQQQNNQYQQQQMVPFQQQMIPSQQFGQSSLNQMIPQQNFNQLDHQPSLDQLLASFNPKQFPNPINQPIRNQEKLLVNGQMGVNVAQTIQQPAELQEKPNTRVIDYIMRQNEVLEKLTQNMASNREKEMNEEKQKLLAKMKKLEQQNAQDAFYNDMYDEIPPHLRYPQQRPPPGYQYAPFFQQQNLYQQQFQSQPYPQPKKSKHQVLQMLRMIKQLKVNQNKKQTNKKKRDIDEIINDGDEVASYSSEESDDEPQIVQKPRILKPRPLPPPPPYDPLDDEEKLKKLKFQRCSINWRSLELRVSFLIWYTKYIAKTFQDKKQRTTDLMPEIYEKFLNDCGALWSRTMHKVIDEMKNSKTNIQIVPKPKSKISPNQMKQNVTKLKEVVKMLFDAVSDNATDADITEGMLKYLNEITSEYSYLMDSQYLKFELNRLKFNYQGQLQDVNEKMQFMMFVSNILIRTLLVRFFCRFNVIVQNITITEQMRTNIKTLYSVVYEALMIFLRGNASIQPNNTKYIPLQNVVKVRKDICFTIDGVEATEEETVKLQEAKSQSLDEPLIHPVYTYNEMASFFDGQREFISLIQGMIDGWCQNIYEKIDRVKQEQLIQKKNEIQQKKDETNKILALKRERVNQILKSKKDSYLQLSIDIKNLQQSMKDKAEEAKQKQEQFKEMQKQRAERASMLNGVKPLNPQQQIQGNGIPFSQMQMQQQIPFMGNQQQFRGF